MYVTLESKNPVQGHNGLKCVRNYSLLVKKMPQVTMNTILLKCWHCFL